MRRVKEESSYSCGEAIDIVSAVKELHRLSSQELNKLLKDSEHFTVNYLSEKGSPLKIEGQNLARCLHLHLMAVIASAPRNEGFFRYLLCGARLLHSLVDLAPRHAKLEQILLDDVKVSKQLLDLVFHLLIVLGAYKQETQDSSPIPLMHSALVACSLYLLTGFICPQWQDLAVVLLAHPKVDTFMDLAVGAVRVNIRFVQIMLSAGRDISTESNLSAEQMLKYLCHQCEASLQFLLSLCQQKMFRERLLRNQNLCRKGGILFLAQAILQLNITEPFVEYSNIVAALSRMKSKVLSLLLHLCEADSISFLDEASSSPNTLGLVKSVTSEVLDLLKSAFTRDPGLVGPCAGRTNPMGLLQLSAMRLADIFSDDSNLRSYVTICFTEVLAAIFSLSHEDFVSAWCSSHRPVKEEEATLEYDLFAAAGWVLDTLSSTNPSNVTKFEFTLVHSKMPQASYSHQRSSLFVKLIANLHCFVPNVCKEQERNLFIHKFLECLQTDPSRTLPGSSFTSDVGKAATVCRNLGSLLSHAESLIPIFLNEEDVQLLRVFFNQLQSLISAAVMEANRVHEAKYEESTTSWEKFPRPGIQEDHQEAQSTEGCSVHLLRKEPLNVNIKGGNMKETVSENSAFQEETQFNARSRHTDQGGGDVKEHDKDESSRSAYGGLREMDKEILNVETSGSDTSSTRGKNSADQMDNNSDFPKSRQCAKESGSGRLQEDEKVEPPHFEGKQRRKRKRTIMNDKQVNMIERALVDEPDMQRNASSMQSWADKLCYHGSEVTASQLKNWLNNRKARLARAAKDVRAPAETDNNAFPDRQAGSILGPLYDSPESTGEEFYSPPNRRSVRSRSRTDNPESSTTVAMVDYPEDPPELEAGQPVTLVDGNGAEVGKGKVYQAQGKWHGRSLEESWTCVVDISELKADRRARPMYPSEATGSSFDEAEMKFGVMRVLWDMGKIVTPEPTQ